MSAVCSLVNSLLRIRPCPGSWPVFTFHLLDECCVHYRGIHWNQRTGMRPMDLTYARDVHAPAFTSQEARLQFPSNVLNCSSPDKSFLMQSPWAGCIFALGELVWDYIYNLKATEKKKRLSIFVFSQNFSKKIDKGSSVDLICWRRSIFHLRIRILFLLSDLDAPYHDTFSKRVGVIIQMLLTPCRVNSWLAHILPSYRLAYYGCLETIADDNPFFFFIEVRWGRFICPAYLQSLGYFYWTPFEKSRHSHHGLRWSVEITTAVAAMPFPPKKPPRMV